MGSGEHTSVQLDALLEHSAALPQVRHYFLSLRQKHPKAAQRLIESAFHRRAASAVFAQSRFLSEDCVANPDWMLSLSEPDLHQVWSSEHYADLLHGELPQETSLLRSGALVLAQFRRRQILRILVRDILGFAVLSEVTEELSNLADSILDVSYQRLRAQLVARYGLPRFVDAAGNSRECGMSVIALGKLGGRELNYSSDVDLMFVYAANGETDGPEQISTKEFYKRLANQYTELLSTYTSEGMCYRVDLRLRPDGSLGEVCIPLEGALKYYRTRARDWELQMLIKARSAAGDRATARELLDAVEPLIYSTTLDFSAIEAVSVTRERISEKLAVRRVRNAGVDIKLAPGGIRDIEFLVQCLQRAHGGRAPWVRHGGTLLALSRLSDKGLLSGAEHGRLAGAYQFLRNLEHRLQLADDRQTHSLPSSATELDQLARRMRAQVGHPSAGGADLMQELNGHLEAVREIYERVIHARVMQAQRQPAAATPTPSQIAGSAALFEHFLERVIQNPELHARLNSNDELRSTALDIFEYSRYFAEQLVRAPKLLDVLGDLSADTRLDQGRLEDSSGLRRSFRREMFRIQAASICLGVPVFETLERTSDLADAAIRVAYRMAVGREEDHPMMVIALGRLGVREFDLSSDADLIFVLPDSYGSEHALWTRIASRIIDILSAYTGDGQLFAVDARLRANGNDGPLVQSESAYKEYFARHAEAWEGLSYMKARAVAGDPDRATAFLHELQDLDWRRYGQGGRSRKDLGVMRQRLEKEQGTANSLKAGPGGYYDIDFLLLYLRLRGAGIFFNVLNTPARIDVVEKMGHLDRADADFLRDAAIFYRAIDHGIRVYSGQAAGSLPSSEAYLEALTVLVRRWTPAHLHHQPLAPLLSQFRERVRELFKLQFS